MLDPPDTLLADLLTRAPADAIAWVDAEGTTTFAEAATRTARLAAAVRSHLGRGHTGTRNAPHHRAQPVVAVLAENSGAYLECLYGIPAAGAAALLLNYRHHPAEWAAMLARTGATLVVGDHDLLARLDPHLSAAPTVRECVAFPSPAAGTTPEPANEWSAFLARGAAAIESEGNDLSDDSGLGERTEGESRPDPTTTAWLVPTSGTTGTPKLARLTHRSLLVAAAGCATARPVADDDIYLFVFPLCHVAAYNVVVYHRFARPIVVERRFDVDRTLGAIERHRVTSASLAPTMIAMLLDAPGGLAERDLTSLRNVAYGSAAIPAPLLRRAMATLPCNYSQGYGMTELSGNCVFLGPEDHRRGLDDPAVLSSAGFATPLVEVQVVDDAGLPQPVGVVGEIAVRGEQVMAGYWDDSTATAGAIVGGWLRTGDLGTLDASGRLRVVDRKKDVIITGGENVASREVEAVLHDHPAVAATAVVGVPDDRWGEVVVAVVVRRSPPGASGRDSDAVDARELDRHCRTRLAGFKVPRRYEFIDVLPLNTTGKIDKPTLRRRLAAADTTADGNTP